MAIPFRQPVQMLTLDRRYFLFPRSILDRAGNIVSIFQFTKTPSQPIYLTPSLQVQGMLGRGREQIIPHVQIIRTSYIGQDRESNECVPDTLYDKLLTLNTKGELRKFMEKWDDITIVPGEESYEWLLEEYRKVGITQMIARCAFINVRPGYDDNELRQIDKLAEKIADVNLDFLWKKIGELKSFAKMWERNELEEHKLAWLNKQLELVSPMIVTDKGYALKKLREMRYKWSETPFDTVVGMRKAKEIDPMIGYRVYGHFALCALEILHDLENGLQIFMCSKCGSIRKRDFGSKRKTCSVTESKECHADRQRTRKRKSREKKV